jgi:hypothetical protein
MKFAVVFGVSHLLGNFNQAQSLASRICQYAGVEKVLVGNSVAIVIFNASNREAVDVFAQFVGLTPMEVWEVLWETDAQGQLVSV